MLQMQIQNINKSKAVFDDIYVSTDPRAYFSVLGALDYMIPDVAESVIRQILAAKTAMQGRPSTVLDVGCSYGINAAIHRFPVNFATLKKRYARREMMQIDTGELARLDRHYYASWPDVGCGTFIGFDASPYAINYANEAGLHAAGVAANLEAHDLSSSEAALIAPADVVLSTGAIGYVTSRTYRRLLNALETTPWVISFVLRMFPYQEFIDLYAERGMVTERLHGATFVQRRFRDEAEFEKTLDTLRAQGIDPQGIESEGVFQAELFLSRPKADAEKAPLEQIVTVSCGRANQFPGRFVQIEDEDGSRTAIEA